MKKEEQGIEIQIQNQIQIQKRNQGKKEEEEKSFSFSFIHFFFFSVEEGSLSSFLSLSLHEGPESRRRSLLMCSPSFFFSKLNYKNPSKQPFLKKKGSFSFSSPKQSMWYILIN